ncbi:SusC/RagA family TonB-linked outer membrane protein [Bacteroidota bacterium]
MNINIRKYYLILLIFTLAAHPVFSQDSLSFVVRGQIVAGKNKPLQDVSVSIEGSDAEPVLSSENGTFRITAPSGNEWLIITPIGNYKSKRVFLNNRTELTISLSEKDMQSGYDDLQVINRVESRRDIITSFTDINLNEEERKNIVSIDQVFQGKVPGMFTSHNSGMPGQGTVKFLRGFNSMNTSNAPLVIIDGMPLEEPGLFESNIEGSSYNPLSSIDPSDISSVLILKDPIITSLYGTKATNGVVYIQTLRAKSTETSIKFAFQSGLNILSHEFIPQLNDEQYKTLANEILVSSPVKEEDFEEDFPGLFINDDDKEYYRYVYNTDWQKLVYNDAVMYDAYVSVEGGSNIATYGLSVGYHDQGGIFKNTGFNRFNVRFTGDLNVFSWFNMKVNSNLSNSNAFLKEAAVSAPTSPIISSLAKPPIMDPYQHEEKGNKLNILDEIDELGTSNPLAVAENCRGEYTNYRFVSSIQGRADITNTLNFNTLFGINFNTLKEFAYMPNKGMELYLEGEAQNISQFTNNYLFSFYNDNFLNFARNFNAIHKFSTSLGLRLYTNTLQVDFGEAKNLPENDEYFSLQSGQSNLKGISGDNAKWNWLSMYNQISYKFNDKYILNTGLSSDFSTKTGDDAETAFKISNRPFGFFYSLGAGWRISDEIFLKDVNGLDNLMFRISYGITGNDDIGTFNALNYYTTNRYRETGGLIPGALPNKTLKYEKSNQFIAGFDLSLWGNRTNFTVNRYVKTTEDLLIYEPLVVYTGHEFKTTNLGTVRNKGLEFSFFQRIVDGEHFKWDFSSVITTIKNEVTDLKGKEVIIPFEGGEFVTREGDPINSFYGYQFEGVFSTFAEADAASLVNSKNIPYGPGDAIYKDISGPENRPDSVIDEYDKVNLGSPIPEVFGSVTNHFRYKRWSLDVMLYFVYGNEVFNYVRYMNERMVDFSNQSSNVLKRWQREGDITDVPRAFWKDPVGNTDFSSRWIEDGSYLRLKNITLGYTIPEQVLVFKYVDIYVTATNLVTLHTYLGYEPEFSYSYNPMEQGIDYGLMPNYRQFLFGIKFGL